MSDQIALGSSPVFMLGDKAFLLKSVSPFSTAAMKVDLERSMLRHDHYRCPFDFLKEHRQWFEWHKRLHFDKQSTGQIITDMLTDVRQIQTNRINREIMFRVMNDCAVGLYQPRAVINGSSA